MSTGNQSVHPSPSPENHTADAKRTGIPKGDHTKESDKIEISVDRVLRFVSTSKSNDGSDSGGDSEDDNDMERRNHGKLPQLGRLDLYDVEPMDSDRLWRLEARRLLLAADSPAGRLLLSSRHGPAPLDREGFNDLAELTDKVLCALHICTLDDQVVLYQTYPSAVDKWCWMQCQSALRNRTDDSHNLPGRQRSRTNPFASSRETQMTVVDPVPSTREIYHEEGEEVIQPMPRHGTSDDEGEEVIVIKRKEVFTESSERLEPEETLQIELDPYLDQDERKVGTHETSSVLRGPQRSRLQRDSSLSENPASIYTQEARPPLPIVARGSMTSAVGMSTSPTLPTPPQPRPHRTQTSTSSQQSEKSRQRTVIRFLTPPVTERRQASNPRELQQVDDPERYCAIVDHVTAVLAHIATQQVQSSYWHTVIVAVLTMLSTKLKVVAIDLPTNVDLCLSGCRKIYLFNSDHDGSNAGLGEWQFRRISDNDTTTSRYCMENAVVSRWLTSCLTQVLVELGAKRPVHVPPEKVDVCAMIFRSGADNLLTLMHQDRHGNIGGLCDALPLALSGAAISQVMELGLRMEKERLVMARPPPPGGRTLNASRPSVVLEASLERMLDHGRLERSKTAIKLVNIADLVTLLVPLSLGKASLAHEFKRTLQAMSALSALGDVVTIATDFTALVQLFSEGSVGTGRRGAAETDMVRQRRRMMREKSLQDLPVKSLSQSGLARLRLHLLEPDARHLPFSAPDTYVESTMTAAEERLNNLNCKAQEWAIDGGAVIVKCPVYVWSIVTVCGVLVLGGFMIAFFVGERIPGVDPFGIASFTWVLAGFIILIAKSVRVSEWPWRDFLLGRVTCRSITELHSVTRVDAQDIIMYFLSTRERNLLHTCGPFNAPFRETRPGGFSIDVKIKLQTLWACGIIPLEVTTLDGRELVFLDLTRGRNGLTSAEHSTGGYAQKDDYIVRCMELPPNDDKRDAPLVLSRNVVWIKVVGIYNCMERNFR